MEAGGLGPSWVGWAEAAGVAEAVLGAVQAVAASVALEVVAVEAAGHQGAGSLQKNAQGQSCMKCSKI